MRGTYITRKAAALCAFQEPLLDITSFKASKKIRTPIAIAQQVRMILSDIAEEVVDERLLIDELLEVNVEISDIILISPFQYKRFAVFITLLTNSNVTIKGQLYAI